MCEQLSIDFGKAEKSTYDNRKIGMAFICFEDQLMNYSSDLKFSTSTSNWRNFQKRLGLGDYGGKFNPEVVLDCIAKLIDEVESKQLSHVENLDKLYDLVLGLENSMKLIHALKKISEVAKVAGTEVRVMIGKVI